MTSLHRNSLPIPDDLAMEIFSRLPSKAMARCRCACKLWSSMLRSQDFTDLFLTKSSARPQLLFACHDHYNDNFIFFSSSPHPEEETNSSYAVVAANHLARFPSYSNKLLGCTSGFLCYRDKPKSKNLVICNPSTGQSLTLPRLKSRKWFRVVKSRVQDLPPVKSYLGYDPFSNEFKVLSMKNSRISAKHQVLTLGTKKLSWRLVQCSTRHYSSGKWISISGVLYYAAAANSSSANSMVACFDLRVEKFSFVNFSRGMHGSTTLVNYNGKLGLLMSADSSDGESVRRASKSLELWVLQDAEWSKHVYVLPPSWKDVVVDILHIAGMVGVNEIVLTPWYPAVPSYVIYFNVERKTVRKVRIQGMEAFRGKIFDTYLNYVENVKLL